MKQFVVRVRPDAVLFMVGGNDLQRGLKMKAWAFSPVNHYARLDKGLTYWRVYLRSRLMKGIGDIRERISSSYETDVQYRGLLMDMTFQPRPPLKPSKKIEKESEEKAVAYLQEYRRNIRTLARMARAKGIRPFFMTQPSLYSDAPAWRNVSAESGMWMLSAATVNRLLKTYNRALLEVCVEEHVDCLDLNARVPHSAEYLWDFVHTTEKGAERIADEAARFLLSVPGAVPRDPRGAHMASGQRRAP